MPPSTDHTTNGLSNKDDNNEDKKKMMNDGHGGDTVTPLANFKFPERTTKKNETDEDEEYVYNSTTLPIVSLQSGLQRKATPWTLASWVKLALTLDGRDKITKVCQYTSRLLAWWFVSQAKRFKAMQTSLTTSRKAYRLGRSLIEIQKISDSGLIELFFGASTKSSRSDQAWKIVGSAMKMIGLMGFWAGDNVNFLTGSGLFDDYGASKEQRMERRSQLKTRASHFANRFYFFGSVAGLLTGLRAYLSHRQGAIRDCHERLKDATRRVAETNRTDEAKNQQLWKDAKQAMDKAREKQFVLFLALLKSCVDVMVFSNNPGIDLHQKYRGKKNHEGFHCLCGLISASTVLYNNFPNKPSTK